MAVGRHKAGSGYLRVYGWQDVFDLWMLSLGLGVVAYLIALLIQILRQSSARRRALRMNLTDGDDPVTALEKLARAGEKSLILKIVYVEGAQDKELFMLGRDPADPNSSLVAPKIEVQIDEVSNEASRLNQLLSNDDVKGTAEYLRTLVTTRKARAAWRDGAGVRRAPTEKIRSVGKERWIV
jgi:hypothetical protein